MPIGKIEAMEKHIARSRESLTDKMVNLGWDLPDLTASLEHLAAQEGKLMLLRGIKMALDSEGGNEERAKSLVLSTLTHGPDDRWSGRGNDIKRARFDGICEVAAEYLRGWVKVEDL